MTTTGTTDPRTVAPEAFAAFDLVRASARAAIDPTLYALARARIATLLGIAAPRGGNAAASAQIAALPSWPSSPLFDERERACLGFAEQFVLDVSGTTDAQRGELTAALGADAAAFAQALYAIDFELRLRAVFTALFGADPLPVEPAAAPEKLWPALEAMMPTIARLTALDPMTTELVRLRGARAHHCRLCKSLRNVRAVEAGGSEAFFDQIDFYERSDFSAPQKAALRLVDAIIWRPGDFPAGLAEEVRAQWSGAQIVEIVVDVTRNALNKFAVAMGVDGIGVGEGIGYYDTDASGELVYGLTPRA